MKAILLFLILAIAGASIAFAASNSIDIMPQHLGASEDTPINCQPGQANQPGSCDHVVTNFHN